MDNKFGTGRYDAILGKLASVSGQLEIAAQLSPEVSPVLVLESDRAEWLYLGNQRLMGGRIAVAAQAASPSVGRIRAPSNSAILGVIELIIISSTSAIEASLRLGTATADRATALTVSPRDSRWQGTLTAGALKMSQDNAAFAGNEFLEVSLAANTPLYIKPAGIVLVQGNHLDLGTTTLNVPFNATVFWREREIGQFEQPS